MDRRQEMRYFSVTIWHKSYSNCIHLKVPSSLITDELMVDSVVRSEAIRLNLLEEEEKYFELNVDEISSYVYHQRTNFKLVNPVDSHTEDLKKLAVKFANQLKENDFKAANKTMNSVILAFKSLS